MCSCKCGAKTTTTMAMLKTVVRWCTRADAFCGARRMCWHVQNTLRCRHRRQLHNPDPIYYWRTNHDASAIGCHNEFVHFICLFRTFACAIRVGELWVVVGHRVVVCVLFGRTHRAELSLRISRCETAKCSLLHATVRRERLFAD